MILQFVIFRSRADELMHVHHELVRVFPATFHFISDNVRYFQDVFTFTEYFFFSAVLLGPVSLSIGQADSVQICQVYTSFRKRKQEETTLNDKKLQVLSKPVA